MFHETQCHLFEPAAKFCFGGKRQFLKLKQSSKLENKAARCLFFSDIHINYYNSLSGLKLHFSLLFIMI